MISQSYLLYVYRTNQSNCPLTRVKDNKPVLTEDLDVAGAVVVVSQLGQGIQLLASLPAQQVLEVGFVTH